jgi:phosphate-selective porin OprO/OprP
VQRDGAKDVHFFGAYAFASWFLTGESRNYDSASGRFLGVTPKQFVERGGWGAWELAVRASTVNLNDEDIVGGRQRDVSLGLNWYVDDQFRLQANLVKVLGVKRPGSEFDGQDPWMAAVRVQWVLP